MLLPEKRASDTFFEIVKRHCHAIVVYCRNTALLSEFIMSIIESGS
jgi:hypothetical protein